MNRPSATDRLRNLVSPLAAGVLLVMGPGAAMAQDHVEPPQATTTLHAYFAAYNAHDVEAVVGFLDPEFTWLRVDGDSVHVELHGIESFRASLTQYFAELPSARSDIDVITALGPWISVRERATWTGRSGPQAQSALSIYEVRAGKLRRVWYYPAVR